MAEPQPLPLPCEIHEFALESVLGAGGFGITYKARDTSLNQAVALKEYFPRQWAHREGMTVCPNGDGESRARYPEFLGKFSQEAQTLARFRHPNIVRVLRCFQANGTAYMVMDYEEGACLDDFLVDEQGAHRPPPETWLRGVLVPLLDGLRAVHRKTFLHRDIKPQNIFIRRDGSPVLLDFGAARETPSDKKVSLTAFYSKGYTPPEQCNDDQQGPCTDIYATAAALYYAVSGLTPPEAAVRRPNDLIRSAVELGKDHYSLGFLEAIDWALRFDSKARPQSIEEWSSRLLAAPPGAAPNTPSFSIAPTTPPPTAPAPTQPQVRANPTAGASAEVTLTQPPPPKVRRNTTPLILGAVGLVSAAIVVLVVAGPFGSITATRAPNSAPPIARISTAAPISPGTVGSSAPPPPPIPEPQVAPNNMLISALGMVDADDTRYKTSPDLVLADLRSDAQRQIVEKAIGIYVERTALDESYESLRGSLFGQGDYIEKIVSEDGPEKRSDGFIYLPMRAEVKIEELRHKLQQLSREQRLALIRLKGSPLIQVQVFLRDATRGASLERSAIAENIVKERIRAFGFRVSSEAVAGSESPRPDFTIESEAKFKTLSYKLPTSGLTIEKYVLTSWTLRCVDVRTGEDVYFDNRVPNDLSWADEDAALSAIGKRIGDAFSRDFFLQYLPRIKVATRLHLAGAPPALVPDLLREFLSLRAVVDTAIEPASADGLDVVLHWYDQGEATAESASRILLAPLQHKLGEHCLRVDARDAGLIAATFNPECTADLPQRLEQLPRAALCDSPLPRLEALVKDVGAMRKLASINPQAVDALAKRGSQVARQALAEQAAAPRVEL